MGKQKSNLCLCLVIIVVLNLRTDKKIQEENVIHLQYVSKNTDNLTQFMTMLRVEKISYLSKYKAKANSPKSILFLYLLILQAGDIQTHPGPTSVKYPCGICNENVNWNARALQCDGCDIWYHTKCTNVDPHIIKPYKVTA